MGKRIEKMTLEELVAGEKAASIVRKDCEDRIAMFRGIDYNGMRESEKEELANLSQRLTQMNAIRLKIINEMENKLLDIEL